MMREQAQAVVEELKIAAVEAGASGNDEAMIAYRKSARMLAEALEKSGTASRGTLNSAAASAGAAVVDAQDRLDRIPRGKPVDYERARGAYLSAVASKSDADADLAKSGIAKPRPRHHETIIASVVVDGITWEATLVPTESIFVTRDGVDNPATWYHRTLQGGFLQPIPQTLTLALRVAIAESERQ